MISDEMIEMNLKNEISKIIISAPGKLELSRRVAVTQALPF
jgi:hypothetical protein